MSNNQTVSIDPIRSLAFGSIGATFTAIGSPLAEPVRLITFVNDTDGGIFVSDDGVNSKLYLPAQTFKLLDCNTNRATKDQYWCIPAGTQWYIKYNTAPSKNSFYIECLWGQS